MRCWKYELGGSVKDENGKGIEGARVIATSADGTIRCCTETRHGGGFAFAKLPGGRYIVTGLAADKLGSTPVELDADKSDLVVTVAQADAGLRATVDQALTIELPDPAVLERYGKVLVAAIAVLTGIGGVFRGTIFQDLARSGKIFLAVGVLLAAISAALAVIGIARSAFGRSRKRCERRDWGRCPFRWAVGCFAAALVAAGLAPLGSLWPIPAPGTTSTAGLAYAFDADSVLVVHFEGRALAPQLGVRLHVRRENVPLVPQAAGLTDETGGITLSVRVPSACASDTTSLVVTAEAVEGTRSMQPLAETVTCPAGGR